MDWWTLPLLTRIYLPPAYRMDISELLRRWYVVLLPRVWDPCSLEAWSVGTMLYDWGCKVHLPLCMWASAYLSGAAKAWKGRGAASWLFVCMSCLSVWSHDSLSLFPSSFLFLFFLSPCFFSFLFFFSFLSFFISLLFSLFFFKQARADIFLKQGYSFGWLELAARRSAIFLTLGFLCESQMCNIGVSFRVCSNS